MIYFEQPPEFYQYLREGDAFAAHMFFIPPILTPLWEIEHKQRMQELKDRMEYERNKPDFVIEYELKNGIR